jgi:hypothetical protein
LRLFPKEFAVYWSVKELLGYGKFISLQFLQLYLLFPLFVIAC